MTSQTHILTIQKPRTAATPLIFDSPHSGTIYPEDFNYACDEQTLKAAEDQYVEDLFASAPDHGATLLHALFPRSYIDPNRARDDIDSALLNEPWDGPFPANPTARADAGIGLVRRLVKPGIPVYDRPLTTAEILRRIEHYYTPYHEALEQLIRETHYNFGQVWHINCHSMPNASAYPRRNIKLAGNTTKPADFVLGDLDGTSCSTIFTRALRHFIESLGYYVTINDPFKGLELISKHTNPARGIHALQIEINKSLYMNESTGQKSENYSALKSDIEKIITFTASFVETRLTDLAAD